MPTFLLRWNLFQGYSYIDWLVVIVLRELRCSLKTWKLQYTIAILVVLTLHSEIADLYGNDAFSILV